MLMFSSVPMQAFDKDEVFITLLKQVHAIILGHTKFDEKDNY